MIYFFSTCLCLTNSLFGDTLISLLFFPHQFRYMHGKLMRLQANVVKLMCYSQKFLLYVLWKIFFFCKRCFLFIDLLPIILFLLWLSRLFFYCSIHPPPSSHTHRHLIWSLFEAKCSRFGFSRFD